MKKRVDILIVDDRLDGLIALEAILTDPRYNLIKAQSGMEALSLLPLHDFAIILLDIQMYGVDGFETASRIKQMENQKHIPIIFVTAMNKDENYIYKGYQAGAVDYVFKPFDENILRSKVAVFVDLYEKSKRVEEQALLIRESANHQRHLRLAQLEVESLKRYQNLADSIPHAVWRSKPDGTMDYFNKVWSEYTGLSDHQSLGFGWQSAFHPEDLKKFLKIWMQKIANAEDFQVECRIRNRRGEMLWHLIRGIAECQGEKQIFAWLGTCTNIHERKDMEESLIKARRAADAANVAKTNFLANMSHEIRTPLNSILGFTELLMTFPMSAKEREKNLATIKKNGSVLLKIIDEILDISKVEAGHLEIEQVELNLNRLYQDLYYLFAIQAHDKNIELTFSCSTPIPSKIVTDPTRYRQILVNIIGNSVKFTEKGKVAIEVSWLPDTTSIRGGLLRCSIVDTGIGIDAAEAKELFQPFVQVDNSNTRKFGGTGLGLALSRRLSEALGGNVDIQKSEKNVG
ncbi:MAG TPA: response regulator, partial [Pseudobdellovibrionaceae bacterium]